MQEEYNCCCKNKNPDPDMLEDGNCICTDCKCHYYKRNLGENDVLQKNIIKFGGIILGTSTILYGMYLFCCEKHISLI
jgi:hypothetical protein